MKRVRVGWSTAQKAGQDGAATRWHRDTTCLVLPSVTQRSKTNIKNTYIPTFRINFNINIRNSFDY